jgi:bifunctional DNA-binding transcriptional regulator/antitoxin component of YhaV-PrlF toxin-antitoxin module
LGRISVIEADRITLPREFRKQAKVRRGDVLEYRIQGASLVISKARRVENPTKRMFGIVSDVSHDLSGDELFLKESRLKLRRSK